MIILPKMLSTAKLSLLLLALVAILQFYFYWTIRKSELSAADTRLLTEKAIIEESGFHSSSQPPPIVFVTPTGYRTAQKADLTRLAQTLAGVLNLFWIIVEDSTLPSRFIDELMARIGIKGVHLTAATPVEKKLNISDPNWKFPRGVVQRNAALRWIRQNLGYWRNGVLFFGDDDNVYDWRLFDEMRTIRRVGVWPVGIVGGLLTETPLLDENASVRGFNAHWKPGRPFPIDMASFAVNISLILANRDVEFTFKSPSGYQESHFLSSFGFHWADLEPKAEKCTKVYVWHTRTEKTPLIGAELRKFLTKSGLTPVQRDAIL